MAIGGEGRPRGLARQVKANRAFRAYIELMDAADWLRGEMSDQLATFDMTMMQFRVMEALFRGGPQYQQLLSERFDCSKQNIGAVLKGLVKAGAVRSDRCRLPSMPTEEVAREAWKRAGVRWHGRWIFLLTLTPKGKRFIARVIREAQEGGEGVDASAGFAGAADAGAVVQEIAAGRCGEIREGYSDDG